MSSLLAPEVINSIESQGSQPLTTTKEAIKFVDIWSCGVVMYVILAGRPPFSGQVKTSEDRRQLLRRISRGVLFPDDKWKNISDHAKDLILRLLSIEVTGRITAKEALDHPFFGSKREASMVIDDIGADYVDVKKELEQIQQGIIDEGDAEGDVSSFQGEAAVKTSHTTTKPVKQKKFSAPL
jgi:serine/threonine protein kinase